MKSLAWILLATIAGCSTDTSNKPAASGPPPTATRPYDGTTYATQVQTAILDSFLMHSFPEACPQPAWVCAIDRIESPRPGHIDVTLQPNWEAALGEWAGPPAGVGCLKWGEQIRRNITNFTTAAHVPTPRTISVYEPDGRPC